MIKVIRKDGVTKLYTTGCGCVNCPESARIVLEKSDTAADGRDYKFEGRAYAPFNSIVWILGLGDEVLDWYPCSEVAQIVSVTDDGDEVLYPEGAEVIVVGPQNPADKETIPNTIEKEPITGAVEGNIFNKEMSDKVEATGKEVNIVNSRIVDASVKVTEG